jgi:hypothetical protein
MQDRLPLARPVPAHMVGGTIFIGLRPAVPSLDDAHPVGPEQMQLAQFLTDPHVLDEGIAGEQEVAVKRLEEIRARHAPVRPAKQRQPAIIRALRLARVGHHGTEAAASAIMRTARCATGFFMNPSRESEA